MQAVWLALGGLVVSAFTSATILPGNSELVLAAFLYKWPDWLWPALLLATGQPQAAPPACGWDAPRARNCHQGWSAGLPFGPAVLLLSWVPLIGDALPLAAGWLRLPWLASLVWLTLARPCAIWCWPGGGGIGHG
jgi:membrane protein YqaA with SNARE-associated domain